MIFTELFPIGVEYNYTKLKFRKNAHSSHFGWVFLMVQVKNEALRLILPLEISQTNEFSNKSHRDKKHHSLKVSYHNALCFGVSRIYFDIPYDLM